MIKLYKSKKNKDGTKFSITYIHVIEKVIPSSNFKLIKREQNRGTVIAKSLIFYTLYHL